MFMRHAEIVILYNMLVIYIEKKLKINKFNG